MRFTDSHGHDGPKTVTPLRLRQGDDRALLQVPTLSTGPRNDVHVVGAVKPNKRPRYEEASPVMPPSSVRRPSPISWMGYRTEEAYPDPVPGEITILIHHVCTPQWCTTIQGTSPTINITTTILGQ